MKKKKINVLKTTKKLKAKLWALVSEYVRRKDTSFMGYGKCYSCPAMLYWKLLQCGHFHHGTLDYDLRNLKKQCARCNKWLHGNLAEYAANLVKEFGPIEFEKLRIDAARNRGYVYKIIELENLIEKFKALLITLDNNY